jgi:hypothetical protein
MSASNAAGKQVLLPWKTDCMRFTDDKIKIIVRVPSHFSFSEYDDITLHK